MLAGLPFSILRINRSRSLFQTNKNKKMKKILLVLAIGAFVASCNEATDKAAETTTPATETTTPATDTTAPKVDTSAVKVDTSAVKPAAADTTKKK